MGTFTSLFLILSGALCLTGLLVKQKPEMENAVSKVDQISGWVGFVLMIWSVIFFIWVLAKLGDLRLQRLVSRELARSGENSWSPFLWWLSNFVISLLSFAISFILGLSVLQKLLLNQADENTSAKINDIHDKLTGIKNLLGIIAVLLGFWGFIYNILVHSRMPDVIRAIPGM
jgi:uncharacterized membrane protein (Fun14 family)